VGIPGAVPFLLSPSDCESLTLRDLLSYADADGRERWERLALGYTESSGLPALREEIARSYEAIAPENVLVLTPEVRFLACVDPIINE
jgi:hypothetical protein